MGALLVLVVAQASFLGYVLVASLRMRTEMPASYSLARIRERERSQPNAPRIHVDLPDIPIPLTYSLIAVEDHRFADHAGFDVEAIQRAIRINREYGYLAYGGSTITQQLARTVFLYTKKSYLRKALEVEAAILMDFVLSKERTLELYLNLVEWGPGVFGLGAAAEYHYGKAVRGLSGEEIVDLLTILASPVRYDPNDIDESEQLRLRRASIERTYEIISQLPSQKRIEIRPVSQGGT